MDNPVQSRYPLPIMQPEPIIMALCEVPRIMLRPDQLYRFVVMPGCAACEAAAEPYKPTCRPS